MPRILIYALDMDMESTASIGIFNYTKNLIATLGSLQSPGIEVTMLVSSANRHSLLPPHLPDWMKVKEVRGEFATGLRRLYADHVLSAVYATFGNYDLIHFPKGWVTILPVPGCKILSTMHDAMGRYLREHYPEQHSGFRARYFDFLRRMALEKSDMILTISETSKRELLKDNANASEKIRIVYNGPGLPCKRSNIETITGRVLIMGSHSPHKATEQSLRLLGAYQSRSDRILDVHVTGISEWASAWGEPPSGLNVRYLGRISEAEMERELESAHALLFLSEMEGFGMPLIEAYLYGTPVCYRNTTAPAEVMKGIQGGWDGHSEESFFSSFEEVLAMSNAEVQTIADGLRGKYNWDHNIAVTKGIYKELTEKHTCERIEKLP